MFLRRIFGWGSKQNDQPKANMLPAEPVGDDFLARKGSFFQTLEYPVTGEDNQTVVGRSWMEAGLAPNTGKWVLWHSTVREMDDPLRGGKALVRKNNALFEATSFNNAYAQMITFEEAMSAQGTAPLGNKTKDKLGVDYFKHFAWAEGLMQSRSGRLYPASEKLLAADNFFNEQDIKDAKAFLDRHNQLKFVPVPLVLPAKDWEKAYHADKARTDQRLRALYVRYGNDVNSFDLARQVIAHETPEVLYAYLHGDVLGKGFTPKIFEKNSAQHFELLKSAIGRDSVEPLHLLSETGLSFSVRYDGETPVERALRERRYSHLHIMLSRDGVKLANYCDETGTSPSFQAISLQDDQAFRMLYLEGIDYSHVDRNGYYLIHQAFAHNFLRGIYAWIDEGLPIDLPIKDTGYTGLSVARKAGNDQLVKFAIAQGASADAPAISDDPPPTPTRAVETGGEEPAGKTDGAATAFSLSLLSSDATNDEITKAAMLYLAEGGNFNVLDEGGLSLLEICWKNHKAGRPELDRRALIAFFGEHGADPSETLADGTTVLTREAHSRDFDLNFIAAVAPYAGDANNKGANGNNIMHALQLNANDQVGHTKNVQAVLKLFPTLDLNRQNDDGYSNIGLAIRLSRSNTLKEFIKAMVVNEFIADFSQITRGGWSYLDIAFTAAFNEEKGKDFPLWANNIETVSDKLRQNVLGMVNRVFTDGNDAQRQALYDVLNRRRPDGRTLAEAMASEQVSDQLIDHLAFCGMKKPQGPGKPGLQPN